MDKKIKSLNLIIVSGLPGSGKSTFASRLLKKVDAALISSDEIAAEFLPRWSDSGMAGYKHLREIVNSEAVYRIEDLLDANKSVIFAGNTNTFARRKQLRQSALKKKATPVLVWMEINPIVAEARTKVQRNIKHNQEKFRQEVSDQVWKILLDEIELPKSKEKPIAITGTESAANQLKSFQSQFKLLYPPAG